MRAKLLTAIQPAYTAAIAKTTSTMMHKVRVSVVLNAGDSTVICTPHWPQNYARI
jgi:hypothetical protein